MKVCIESKADCKTGKGFFINRLITALEKQGAEIVDRHTPADIDLQVGRHHYPVNARKSVIRLGPAHVNKKQDYKALNKVKWKSVNHADGVVYQSQFSKKVCRKFIGKPVGIEEVIFNGADPEFYGNIEPIKSDYKHNFLASTREWIPQKRLSGIIKSFIRAEIPDSCLRIAGTILKNENKDKRFVRDNIFYLGNQTEEQLGALYKGSSAMIHCVHVDACPNSVVEAMVAGLNVIRTNQGALPEFGDYNLVDDAKFIFKPINLETPPRLRKESLIKMMKLFVSIKRDPPDAEWLHIDKTAKQYIKFFEKVLCSKISKLHKKYQKPR